MRRDSGGFRCLLGRRKVLRDIRRGREVEPRSVAIRGVALEVFDWGAGEPVLLIQTALTADELRPLATDPALDGYRKILYHRRGYAGSSSATGAPSISRDAADCSSLLAELNVDGAHVVGVSYSAAVALQLAVEAPERTRTVTLLEPPPVHTPSAAAFRAANEQLMATRREKGTLPALAEFLSRVIGADWQEVAERQLPGSSAQMRRDVGTFLDVDLPALLSWRFGPQDASGITCPILYVGGSDSGPWFAEVRELILGWFPNAEDVVIDGADHSLALTHAAQIARSLAAFLQDHSSNTQPGSSPAS